MKEEDHWVVLLQNASFPVAGAHFELLTPKLVCPRVYIYIAVETPIQIQLTKACKIIIITENAGTLQEVEHLTI